MFVGCEGNRLAEKQRERKSAFEKPKHMTRRGNKS
jgi:hypothetical protein